MLGPGGCSGGSGWKFMESGGERDRDKPPESDQGKWGTSGSTSVEFRGRSGCCRDEKEVGSGCMRAGRRDLTG